MNVKVLTQGGIVEVEASELTFREHLTVIGHWRAVYRSMTGPGRVHEGDEEWLADRMEVLDRAEEELRSGRVPYKIEGPS